MEAIRLIELGFHRNTFEKEWIKRHIMELRQFGKDPIKRDLVLRSPIWWRKHTDEQHLGTASLDLSDHLVEIIANGGGIYTAQRIVGAELQNDEIRLVGERPIEPCQAACRGVSGDPIVDDAHFDPLPAQHSFEPRREGLLGRQPIARGQAVAKIENDRNMSHGGPAADHQAQPSGDQCSWGHRVENSHCRAISTVPPAAGRRIRPADLPRRFSWLGQNMTSSLHSGGPLMVLEDVHLTLGSAAGPVNILRGVSLRIATGETVSLIGPSGSGKSTLMMVVGGLERPNAGRVRIDGNDFGTLNEDALARLRRAHIGIVFQAFHLIPTMTALENVALPLELAGRRDALSVAARGLAAVGLDHRVTHYPGQLSGGEQQRVAIARAFIAGPKLLLADEPTGNLDATTGRLVIDCLFEHQARHGTTLLLITHDPSVAERCERQIHLLDGRIVEDQRTAQIAAVQRVL